MDKFQFWLYVIIGIIYVLTRFKKKPQQPPKDLPEYKPEKPARTFDLPPARPTAPSASAPRPMSFEELLREITEGKSAERPAESPVVDYDDVLVEEEQDLEDVNYDEKRRDPVAVEYEDAKRAAFNRLSLEETMHLEDTDVRFGKFKVFEKEDERNLLNEYMADLRDPEGWKKAVVMSEILKRKF